MNPFLFFIIKWYGPGKDLNASETPPTMRTATLPFVLSNMFTKLFSDASRRPIKKKNYYVYYNTIIIAPFYIMHMYNVYIDITNVH